MKQSLNDLSTPRYDRYEIRNKYRSYHILSRQRRNFMDTLSRVRYSEAGTKL